MNQKVEMRKLISALMLAFLMLLSGSFIPRTLEKSNLEIGNPVACLPAALQIVDEEAFKDTALKTVEFDDQIRCIMSQAFSDTEDLLHVYIPEGVELIAEDAFSCSGLQVIHGIANSYTQTWANDHGICFIEDDIWNSRAAARDCHFEVFLVLFSYLVPIDSTGKINRRCRARVFIRSMRPQDRIELYPINYRFP